ncbi:MAG: tetratricopeptide repeat protein [Planctomycetes bacterium]|nr:tetratricopeptide repeat protein [Planctomycetota bacterium]
MHPLCSARLLRVIGFFLLALVLASVLGHVPVIGPLFANNIFGILLASMLLSAALTKVGERLLTARKLRSEVRTLAVVGNAYNYGKLGALYMAHGRARAAREPLEKAVEGEPQVAEWRYRLGLAYLASREHARALAAFEQCVALEEEHAYGVAQLRRTECLQRLGRHACALEALGVFERNHGPSPESAYRRGQTLRSLGRRAEARAAFGEVAELARRATRYQKRSASWWALRASLARRV